MTIITTSSPSSMIDARYGGLLGGDVRRGRASAASAARRTRSSVRLRAARRRGRHAPRDTAPPPTHRRRAARSAGAARRGARRRPSRAHVAPTRRARSPGTLASALARERRHPVACGARSVGHAGTSRRGAPHLGQIAGAGSSTGRSCHSTGRNGTGVAISTKITSIERSPAGAGSDRAAASSDRRDGTRRPAAA